MASVHGMIGSMEQGSTSLCKSASNGYGNSTLQPKHNVFVSLSGAPKGFVEQLCVDPERWDRPPFFDKRRDSLSIGEDFPRYIFEGIEQCEVGLVVLSEELFTSKWPMLELVAMTNVKKRKRNFTTMPVLLDISLSEQLENLKRKSLPENLGDGFDRISVHHLWREFASLETKVGKFEKRRRMFEWNRYNLFEEASVTNGGCLVNVRQMFSLDKGFLELEDMNFFRFPSVTVLKINPNFPTLEQLDLRGLKHLQSLELEFIDDWVKRSEILMSITELGSLLKLGFLRWLNIPTESPCFDKISHLANLQVLDLYGCGSVPDLSNLILLQVACFRHNDFVTTIIGFNWNHINLQFLDLSCCKALQSCPGVGELISLQELSLSYCSQLKEMPNLQKLKRLRKLDVGLCSLLQGLPGLGDLFSLLELHASWCSSLAELRGIHNLINLRILDLRYCKMIKSLPGLNELVCLRSLNMSGCENLTQLPEMQKLMNLQSLELDPNAPLQSFVGLSDLISLRSLHVGIDEVHDGPNLCKLTMLKRLHITGWQGQGVSSLAELVLLESAIVRHCKGVRVLPDLHRLSRLGELDFRRCEFEDMSGMSQLASLQTLKIRDCDKLRVLPDLPS